MDGCSGRRFPACFVGGVAKVVGRKKPGVGQQDQPKELQKTQVFKGSFAEDQLSANLPSGRCK